MACNRRGLSEDKLYDLLINSDEEEENYNGNIYNDEGGKCEKYYSYNEQSMLPKLPV